jgi:co-chaperonin GroES (HSP10)
MGWNMKEYEDQRIIQHPPRPSRRADLPTFEAAPVFETPTPEAMGYIVSVKPRDPKRQVGLLATAARTQAAEQALETIGQILAIGELAWTKDFALDKRPKVGDWVVYRQHAGQRMKVKSAGDEQDPDGSTLVKFILLLQDTDILARFSSLTEANRFFAWI